MFTAKGDLQKIKDHSTMRVAPMIKWVLARNTHLDHVNYLRDLNTQSYYEVTLKYMKL